MTVDDVLNTTAELLRTGDGSATGPGLVLQVHQAIAVAAAGWPALYVEARDRLALEVGAPVGPWLLAGATSADAAFACGRAAHPVLHLVTGS